MPESLPAPLVGTILDELETLLQRAHWTLNELQETIDDRRTTKSLVAGRQLMLDVGNVQMAIGRLVALEGKEVELVRVSGRGRRWFVLALGGEVAVIAGAGVYAVIVSGTQSLPEHARAIVVALLACAMGWRNRAILEAEIPDMPTTVVQTSLVKALADVVSVRSGSAQASVLARSRRAGTIFGIFTGGAIGALLLRLGPGPALMGVAGFEACVAALYSRAPRFRPRASAGH
jgi:hypothetical protein